MWVSHCSLPCGGCLCSGTFLVPCFWSKLSMQVLPQQKGTLIACRITSLKGPLRGLLLDYSIEKEAACVVEKAPQEQLLRHFRGQIVWPCVLA